MTGEQVIAALQQLVPEFSPQLDTQIALQGRTTAAS